MSDPLPSAATLEPSSRAVALFSGYFVLLGLGLLYLVAVVWPPDFEYAKGIVGKESDLTLKDIPSDVVFFASRKRVAPASGKSSPLAVQTSLSPDPSANQAELDDGLKLRVTYDKRLLLAVMLLGALGSYIHATTSFADYVGNRRLVRSWLLWYLLRPLVGAPTALLLYFVVRAGFLTATASAGDVNRFGIGAIAGLAGMFSLKAADKMKELFDTLFKTDEKRKDSLQNPVPTVRGLKPDKHPIGTELPGVLVEGSGFVARSIVQVNDSTRETEFRSATQLFVKLQAADVAKLGAMQLTVVNPPPGGGTSAPVVFEVDQPAPTISGFEPEVLSRGAGDLKVLGAGFVEESVVTLNGRVKPSSLVTVATVGELTVKLVADDTGPGVATVEVEVSNPPPGGGKAKKEIEVR